MEEQLRREIIMEHYQNPLNNEIPNDNNYIKVNSNNVSCIDNIDLYLLFDKNIIKDIKFSGEACAISTSSTSIMIKNLIGKSITEAIDIIENFENMINEKNYDENKLNEAIVYNEIYKQANRKNCVLLPYKGIKEELKKRL